MIEWGNNWARGLKFRRNNNEAFAGFMSQVGRLNNVHHIWCKYNDLIVSSHSLHWFTHFFIIASLFRL